MRLFSKRPRSGLSVGGVLPVLKGDGAVALDNTPISVQRGWKKRSNGFAGYYRTAYGAWKGEIFRKGDRFKVYIFHPPMEKINNHPRWMCFYKRKGGKYEIKLDKQPTENEIDSIIQYIERVIYESYRLS